MRRGVNGEDIVVTEEVVGEAVGVVILALSPSFPSSFTNILNQLCMCAYVYVCMCMCVCLCMCARVYFVCLCMCVCMCVFVFMSVCMCVF